VRNGVCAEKTSGSLLEGEEPWWRVLWPKAAEDREAKLAGMSGQHQGTEEMQAPAPASFSCKQQPRVWRIRGSERPWSANGIRGTRGSVPLCRTPTLCWIELGFLFRLRPPLGSNGRITGAQFFQKRKPDYHQVTTVRSGIRRPVSRDDLQRFDLSRHFRGDDSRLAGSGRATR
jgi:hypothetical protein